MLGDLIRKTDKQPHDGRDHVFINDWHLSQGLKINIMFETEIGALALEFFQIRRFQQELADEQVGDVLPLDPDRRRSIGQSVAASIDRIPLAFFHLPGEGNVTFDAASECCCVYPVEFHT